VSSQEDRAWARGVQGDEGEDGNRTSSTELLQQLLERLDSSRHFGRRLPLCSEHTSSHTRQPAPGLVRRRKTAEEKRSGGKELRKREARLHQSDARFTAPVRSKTPKTRTRSSKGVRLFR
jgi:hypothetical protein